MGRPLGNLQEQRGNGTVLVLVFLFFFLRGGGSWVLETTLVDQGNIEDLYFQSLGISEQASNAPGQSHWCFPRIFLESWLSASSFVDVKIATSLNAQARQLHLFQSQGNFLTRGLETNVLFSQKKSMRNVGKIRCEFQTAGYLVLWKPHPATGYVNIGTAIQLFK